MKIKCTIVGICPLMNNRFPDEDNKEGKSKKKVAHMSSEEEATQGLYLTGKNKLYQPSSHIEGAMLKASTSFKLEGKKTYKDLVKGGVIVNPDQIIHKHQKWEIDRRSCVIPSTRGRIMVSRPVLPKWELSFEIEIIDERAEFGVMKEILEYAGLYIGIGTYRPKFGRFEVKKFTKVK